MSKTQAFGASFEPVGEAYAKDETAAGKGIAAAFVAGAKFGAIRVANAFFAASREAAHSSEQPEAYTSAEQAFTDYFVRNYPGPDTIIFDPKWHAPKLFAAAARFIREATPTPSPHVRGSGLRLDDVNVRENLEANDGRNRSASAVSRQHADKAADDRSSTSEFHTRRGKRAECETARGGPSEGSQSNDTRGVPLSERLGQQHVASHPSLPSTHVEGRWLPIDKADKTITNVQEFSSVGLTLRNSDTYWVRDEDGRVYEAAWSEGTDGRNYWWDWEEQSPVDPVEFMPHPLDTRFATTEGSADV